MQNYYYHTLKEYLESMGYLFSHSTGDKEYYRNSTTGKIISVKTTEVTESVYINTIHEITGEGNTKKPSLVFIYSQSMYP